jgi:hypothetical protein
MKKKMTVLLKFTDYEEEISTHLIASESGGAWFAADKALAFLICAKNAQDLPLFAAKNPAIFVPSRRVEWMIEI